VAAIAVVLLAACAGAAAVLAGRGGPAGRTPARPVARSTDPAPGGRTAGALGAGQEGGGSARPLRAGTGAVAATTTTGAGPLRVLEIGDSLGVDLGMALDSAWAPAGVVVAADARGDTGLANSGYFDWPAALPALIAATRPEVVIVLLGANDMQGIVTGGTALAYGSPAWQAAYAARVTSIVSESARAGAKVLWIGEPAMEDPALDAGMALIDGIASRVVAGHPGSAAYLDPDTVLAPTGAFTFSATGPSGQQVQARTPDGVHLTPDGAALLAGAVARALATVWHIDVPG
jgi:hypothetical protein